MHFGAAARRPKTFKNRSANASNSIQLCWAMRTALTGVLGMAPKALGASLVRPGDAFGWLLAAFNAPGAPQDWLWGGIWVPKNRPERVWTRPRNGRGHPKRPKIDFSSIFDRLGMDLRLFSNDFLSIFVRAACDEGAKAESQKGVA